MSNVKFQLFVFVYAIYGGVLVGLFFDVYRALLNRGRRHNNFIMDTIFLLGVLFIFTWILFLSTYGEIRAYILLGIAIGLMAYLKIFSCYAYDFILKIKLKIMSAIRYNLLYNILYEPMYFIIKKYRGACRSAKVKRVRVRRYFSMMRRRKDEGQKSEEENKGKGNEK